MMIIQIYYYNGCLWSQTLKSKEECLIKLFGFNLSNDPMDYTTVPTAFRGRAMFGYVLKAY